MTATALSESRYPIELEKFDRGWKHGKVVSIGDRTALAIATTGASLAAKNGDKAFLTMTDDAVDLSRLVGGPLLKNHDWGLDSVIGSVRRAWLAGDCLYAEVGFARHAQHIAEMVADGHLLKVSIGFEILEAERYKDEFTMATRWRPFEVSIVALGDDPYARFCSREEHAKALKEMAADTQSAAVRARIKAFMAIKAPTWREWAPIAAAALAGLGTTDPGHLTEALAAEVERHIDALADAIVADHPSEVETVGG